MLKTTLLFSLLFFIFSVNAQTSFSISGVVSDSKGGETLPGATIFLSGTKLITASSKNGSFQIANVAPGSYVLIAKYIGFQPFSMAVNIVNSNVSLKLVLKENSNLLNQVVITADPDWEAHYEEFKRRFVGTTPNGAKCKILNKEALHFHVDKETHTLTASADEFLKIDNEALGYKINYLLESFEFNTATGILKYQGYPSFQDMESKGSVQSDLWKKNRKLAYEGSPLHFMKSIFDGDIYKQGFRVYNCNYDPRNPIDDKGDEKQVDISPEPILFDSLLTQTEKNFKVLRLRNSLFVVYTNEPETFNFRNSGYQLKKPIGINYVQRGQYSIVSLLENDVTVDINGNFSPPGALLLKGHMAWEQIADSTPLEYKDM